MGHKLLIKSALLMPTAKKDEVNIVEIESEGYNKEKVKVPILAMKGGNDLQTYVDILAPIASSSSTTWPGKLILRARMKKWRCRRRKAKRRMFLPVLSRRSRAQQTLRSARPPRPGTRWTTRRRRSSPVPLSRVQPRPALLSDV